MEGQKDRHMFAGITPVKRILRGGIEIAVEKPNVIINYIKYGRC